jgi:hypothetical protein
MGVLLFLIDVQWKLESGRFTYEMTGQPPGDSIDCFPGLCSGAICTTTLSAKKPFGENVVRAKKLAALRNA